MTDEGSLVQLRARLMSLRGQRQRLTHREADLERKAAVAVEQVRRKRDDARAALAVIQGEVSERRAQIASFERAAVPSGDGDDWHRNWRLAAEELRGAEHQRAVLEARAADADTALARTIQDLESATTEQMRSMSELDREIDHLMRAITDIEAKRPLPEEPDPQFREALLDRLQHLDDERVWVQEEISMRDERLRHVNTEAAHIRSLLAMHTYEWGKEALPPELMDSAAERAAPAWRAAVVETLTQAGEPMHYRDIAIALAKLGQGLGGQDPAETLLAALSRDADFQRVGRGVYWLKSQPVPRQWQSRTASSGRTAVRVDRQKAGPG
jgi:multidrug resistance efflux pump